MTFCKGLNGKAVCLTKAGRAEMVLRFKAKKARFMAKRAAHLAQFKKMTTAYTA